MLGLLVLAPRVAHASPLEFISPRDPLAAELRVLELYDLPPDSGRFRLPHLNTRPLRRLDLMGDGPPFGDEPRASVVTERIERCCRRDAIPFVHAGGPRSTPAIPARWPGGERLGLGRGRGGGPRKTLERKDSRWRD